MKRSLDELDRRWLQAAQRVSVLGQRLRDGQRTYRGLYAPGQLADQLSTAIAHEDRAHSRLYEALVQQQIASGDITLSSDGGYLPRT